LFAGHDNEYEAIKQSVPNWVIGRAQVVSVDPEVNTWQAPVEVIPVTQSALHGLAQLVVVV